MKIININKMEMRKKHNWSNKMNDFIYYLYFSSKNKNVVSEIILSFYSIYLFNITKIAAFRSFKSMTKSGTSRISKNRKKIVNRKHKSRCAWSCSIYLFSHKEKHANFKFEFSIRSAEISICWH